MRRTRRQVLEHLGLAGCLLAAPRWALQAASRLTDSVGREIVTRGSVEKVFPAGPPAAIFLYMLAPDLMAGWPRALRSDEYLGIAPAYRHLPVVGRLTGRGGSANLETVLAIAPDMILDYGSLKATYVSLADRVQQQTGIPYALIDGRFDHIPESFASVGALVGRADRGRACAREAQAIIDELAAVRARIAPHARPRVYYGRGADGLATGLEGSINIELLEHAGAVNVAEAAGEGGLARVSLEQIIGWDPDVILTTDPNFYALVWNHPVWKTLPAVRDGRVYLSPSIPFGWFDRPPSANRLIGLRWLLSVLYPDEFAARLPEVTRSFYSFFYHVDLDDAAIDTILGPGTRPGTG